VTAVECLRGRPVAAAVGAAVPAVKAACWGRAAGVLLLSGWRSACCIGACCAVLYAACRGGAVAEAAAAEVQRRLLGPSQLHLTR